MSGYIGYRKVPTLTDGGGIWRIGEQAKFRKDGIWPLVDPYFSNVVLLLPMTGADNSTTFTDLSLSPKTITRVGGVKISTTQSKWNGGAGYFDGNGDGLYSNTSTDLDVGNNSWVIECWLYMNNTTGTQMVVGYNNTSPTDFWDITIVSGVPTFKRRISGVEVAVSGGSISATTWTHLAVVRNGTAVHVYIGGSSVANNSNVTMPTGMTDNVLGIGYNRYGNGYEYWLNAYMNDLRITKGVARYTGNFTPPTAPFSNN